MVHLNPRTKRWFFRVTVRGRSDGSNQRIQGTPGVPGPYHDLPQSKAGALEAERRAIRQATYASTIDASALRKAVDDFAAAALRRGQSRGRISNTLSVLSRLVWYATGEKMERHLPPRETRTETRPIDPADIERLLGACEDDRYRAAILLANDTGLRAGEILDLQWSDLKGAALVVRMPMHYWELTPTDAHTVATTKTRIVPLSSRLAETLAALPRRGQWVVSRLDGGKIDELALVRSLGAICDRAKFPRPPGGLLSCLRRPFRIKELAKKGK